MPAKARRHPVEIFVRWDQAMCGFGVVALLAVHAFVVADRLLVLQAGCVGLTGVALGAARRPQRRGDTARAVSFVAVASLPALVASAAVTPFVQPVLVVGALLPLMLAVPYVGTRSLVLFVAGSTATAVAVTFIAREAEGDPVAADVPGWISDAVVGVFLPAAVGLTGLITWHNHAALVASRARLVSSTDQARRTIERDLHDGAQQRLVSVSMQLGLAASLIGEEPDLAQDLLVDLEVQANLALVELRDLCVGVYPPALTDFGLTAALQAAARSHASRCRLQLADVGRLPERVETAAYFACAEALQNAVKHAGADAVITVICERPSPRRLRVAVADDGVGFDPSRARSGRGLVNITDRINAVGGACRIMSAPGRGTRVECDIPLRDVFPSS